MDKKLVRKDIELRQNGSNEKVKGLRRKVKDV
jgi:hypothetical protein